LSFSQKISSLLELFKTIQTVESINEKSYKSWSFQDGSSIVATDINAYSLALEKIYEDNSMVGSRFSRKTVFKYIEDRIPRLKISGKDVESSDKFFKELLDIKPMSMSVFAPISGVRLDGGVRTFTLSSFGFGYLQDLEMPMANENGMYISTTIENVYDKEIALHRADNSFLNFIKLIIFLSGKQDRSILIETGLPLKPDISHERMYVSTSSYQVQINNEKIQSSDISNIFIEKIPVNHEFFVSREGLGKVWELYERKHVGQKIGDLEARVLNAALALGESASTKDARNSILYTCIALEILFSRDDGALFQKSIGQNVADLFAFIVAKDVSSRKEIAKLTKKVYGMRSAIVHGGEKEMSGENMVVNVFMRAALAELLTADRFRDVTRLSTVFEMMQDAQYSY
jgi:hypothetical protein